MPLPFSTKFGFALKALSLSRGRLAAELGVDKSVVGRWVRGAVRPSADNLARLSALVAERIPGFTALDWERDMTSLARALGVDPQTAPGAGDWRPEAGPLADVLDEVRETTARRGEAYEGFFRSTRPYASFPGLFLHDQMMIRTDPLGLLRFDLRCDKVRVEGWVLPQHNQLFIAGVEDATGSLAFGIFNGVNATRADVIEGVLLACALDAGRTPTACVVVFERIEDLTGDGAADEARLGELAKADPVAPEASISDALRAHLARDIGPAQLALGGDWLLRLPLARSMSRGPAVV